MATKNTPDLTDLINQAVANALTQLGQPAPEEPSEPETPSEPTPQDAAEALAEAQGLRPTKGRVYLSADAVKAAARVAKGGKPEAVACAGGRATHVVFWLNESGEVAAQNYYKQG